MSETETEDNRNEKATLEIGALKDIRLTVSFPKQYSDVNDVTNTPALKGAAPSGYDYLAHIDGDADLHRSTELTGSTQPVWWIQIHSNPHADPQSLKIVSDGEEAVQIDEFGPHSSLQLYFDSDELRLEAE